MYLNWFYDWTYNQSAVTTEAREEYIKQYSKPGALRAGFEYYRAVFEDAKQNKEYGKENFTTYLVNPLLHLILRHISNNLAYFSPFTEELYHRYAPYPISCCKFLSFIHVNFDKSDLWVFICYRFKYWFQSHAVPIRRICWSW